MTSAGIVKGHKGYPIGMGIIWFILVVVAATWAQERILYQDTAFGMFRMANGILPIEHGRYGMLPLVWPAWAALKLGVPLGYCMAMLSATSIAIPAISSFLIYKINPSSRLFLLPLAMLMATGGEWYFLGIAEMNPALCYASIAVAFAFRENSTKIHIAFAVLFSCLAFFTHPGVLPFLLFLSIGAIVYQNNKSRWLLLFFLILIVVIKKYGISSSTYEQEIISNAGIFSVTQLFQTWSWGWVLGGFIPHFLFAFVILLLGLYLSLQNHKWYAILSLFIAALCILFMVIFIFPNGDSNLMMEKNFAPVILAWFLPFFIQKTALQFPIKQNILFAIILLAVGIQSHIKEGEFYHTRLIKLNQLVGFQNEEKTYLIDTALHADEWRVTWALPYETLLYTAANHNRQVRTIKPIKQNADSALLQEKNMFYGADFAYKINTDTLNSSYFHFTKNGIYHNAILVTKKEK